MDPFYIYCEALEEITTVYNHYSEAGLEMGNSPDRWWAAGCRWFTDDGKWLMGHNHKPTGDIISFSVWNKDRLGTSRDPIEKEICPACGGTGEWVAMAVKCPKCWKTW